MALPSSGAISLNNVNVELGNSGTAYITMGSADVRGLFGVASGAIGMSDGYGASAAEPRSRGLFSGGWTYDVNYNIIDYITIASTGNATDFGDLTVARQLIGALASPSRGVQAGGTALNVHQDTMDYITIASTGNATDFGNLVVPRQFVTGAASDTRGVFSGSRATDTFYVGDASTLDYITIASTGNAASFGDLTSFRGAMGSFASATRGVFAGGRASSVVYHNVIDYITIASTGNATDFGNLTVARYSMPGCASATRGIFGGGYSTVGAENVMDYVTIASTGNATDFGDLSVAYGDLAAVASPSRGVFGGFESLVYVTITSTGNASAFGDLTTARGRLTGCSGA